MKNTKKLTLLHSNDMHGDFLEENVDSSLVGGVSRLAEYRLEHSFSRLQGFALHHLEQR